MSYYEINGEKITIMTFNCQANWTYFNKYLIYRRKDNIDEIDRINSFKNMLDDKNIDIYCFQVFKNYFKGS